MDLLKTILLYLTMVFVSSVQTVPEPSVLPNAQTPVPVQTVLAVATATPEPTPTPTPVPTPAITPNNDYHTLKVGDKGDDVKLLQRRLAELGYYSGDVDGVFGNQTRRSVERFQYYQGLSVDGIAGKRTLTVLYESTEVVYAPVDVSPSPSSTPAKTVGPTVAITSAPPTVTPAPTFVPTPTPVASATASVAPITVSADAETLAPTQEPVPTLLDQQVFVLAGADTPIVKQTESPAPSQEPETLHPLQVGEQVYVPFLELLRSAGYVLIPGTGTDQQEYAFSIGNDIFQINYVVDNEGNVTNLTVLKNQTPQILSLRAAVLWEGILYLPMNVTQELTGVVYTPDASGLRYTVTMPGLDVPETTPEATQSAT